MVLECVFEDLEAKQTVFHEVENLVTESVILSSSTSCLMPSNVFSCVQNRTRCIISHPVNPPYYVRLVELVPHPETLPAVMDVAYSLMTEVGQAPVRLSKEIDGFALNRVQYAIIAESWRLVQSREKYQTFYGLLCCRNAKPHFYCFVCPGMEDYLQRYSEGMKRVLSTFGPVPDFSGEPAARIVKEICELIPAEQEHLTVRRERRDQLLMELAKLKK
ncbi:lambda-crystallin homolog [Sinocyclocheilus grahami]|uniref:lambda-crystallin homolog n=1 Tax=Sinocyclocheilus grahami TaxID=75366 RepID=UPI0007ACD345|nr:PREDICTED: lambda-crystallin homolog [Sinocyclocheilus grahami]